MQVNTFYGPIEVNEEIELTDKILPMIKIEHQAKIDSILFVIYPHYTIGNKAPQLERVYIVNISSNYELEKTGKMQFTANTISELNQKCSKIVLSA